MKKKKRKGGGMAVFTKPSVFVVKATEEKKADFYEKLNKHCLSKEFIEECLKTSNKLRNPGKK